MAFLAEAKSRKCIASEWRAKKCVWCGPQFGWLLALGLKGCGISHQEEIVRYRLVRGWC
jgi:hypothetical protein